MDSRLLALFATSLMAMPPGEAQVWRADLRFMAKEMERLHKNLYHDLSREEFAARVNALDANIPSLDRHQVIVEMAKIVAAVGDGHTNIYPTRDPRIGFHTLPVAFGFFENDLYVRAAHESQLALIGAKVVRIGNLDVGRAYESVATMIGRDNEQGSRYWAPYLLAIPEVLHALGVTVSLDEIPLKVVTSQGEIQVTLHPFESTPIMTGDTATLFNRREGWKDARDLRGESDPFWLRRNDEVFYVEHIGKLLYARINKIGNSPQESLAHFAQRLHDEISATEPDKMVIDLRLNRGGDGTLITPLIRGLIQSERIDQKGRLFCFIGPATFSAAQMLANALEKSTNVTFVGEPTGSKGNVYGHSRIILLPNTGIAVRVSVYYWQNWHPQDNRDATYPQLPAPLTWDAYVNGVDTALEAVASMTPKP